MDGWGSRLPPWAEELVRGLRRMDRRLQEVEQLVVSQHAHQQESHRQLAEVVATRLRDVESRLARSEDQQRSLAQLLLDSTAQLPAAPPPPLPAVAPPRAALPPSAALSPQGGPHYSPHRSPSPSRDANRRLWEMAGGDAGGAARPRAPPPAPAASQRFCGHCGASRADPAARFCGACGAEYPDGLPPAAPQQPALASSTNAYQPIPKQDHPARPCPHKAGLYEGAPPAPPAPAQEPPPPPPDAHDAGAARRGSRGAEEPRPPPDAQDAATAEPR